MTSNTTERPTLTNEDLRIAASACELLADLDDGAQVDVDLLRAIAKRIADEHGPAIFPAPCDPA